MIHFGIQVIGVAGEDYTYNPLFLNVSDSPLPHRPDIFFKFLLRLICFFEGLRCFIMSHALTPELFYYVPGHFPR